MTNLNEWQKQIVTGTVLGGSSLEKPRNGRNYCLSMRNNNEMWMLYKMKELDSFYRSEKLIKTGSTFRCRSMCSTEFTNLHSQLYDGRYRKVSEPLLSLLTDTGVATWFLESGGKTGRDRKNAYLATTKYGEEGSECIRFFYDEILEIPCKIHKNGNRYRIVFTVDGTNSLFSIIAHKFPVFMYGKIIG